jgi:hypothetical protein
MKKLLIGLIVLVALLSVPMAVSAVNTADVTVTADVTGTFNVACDPAASWTIEDDPDYIDITSCTTDGNIAYDTQISGTNSGYLRSTSLADSLQNALQAYHSDSTQPSSWQTLTGSDADFGTLVNIADGAEDFDLWLQQDLDPTDVAADDYTITITLTLIAAV